MDIRLSWNSSETSDGLCRNVNSTSLSTDDLSESKSACAVLVLMEYNLASISSLSESSDQLALVGSCSLVTSLSSVLYWMPSSIPRGTMGVLCGERVRCSFVLTCAKVMLCGERVMRGPLVSIRPKVVLCGVRSFNSS